MARQVINTTHSANRYDILSQTPKNYSADNYFLKELQDKVNAEWEYRPNRVDIEYENKWGYQTYTPIEVVMQSVKSEKGVDISDDYRKIVFKDILNRQFSIGSRFRFGVFGDRNSSNIPDEQKNVWLSTNTDSVKMTSSMIIERCNGTLGSIYKDTQGVAHYHYEPVIQRKDLSAVSFMYNDMAVSPQAQLEITAQHNDYTRDYFINQRFVVGYDRVYRIKAINKFYSNSTFDVENVGLIRIYLELTETSPKDDFTHRIAYQGEDEVIVVPDGDAQDEYTIRFDLPTTVPKSLDDEPVVFKPVVLHAGVLDPSKTVRCSYSLAGLTSGVSKDSYVSVTEANGVFTVTRRRLYLGGDLTLEWSVFNGDTPVGSTVTFNMDLRG